VLEIRQGKGKSVAVWSVIELFGIHTKLL